MAKNILAVGLLLCLALRLLGSNEIKNNPYKALFEEAYNQNPAIPLGLLDAISYTQTRFVHLQAQDQNSCVEIPKSYGLMGLCLDGKNYFRNNLKYISKKSGISVEGIISDPARNVMAFAAAFSAIAEEKNIRSKNPADFVPVLIELSELPITLDIQNDFALNSYLYSVLVFLNEPANQTFYHFPNYNINLPAVFGNENFRVLSSSHVTINAESVFDNAGNNYRSSGNQSIYSSDYGPAIWNAAASCNYSSRNGTAISAITIHDVEGTYAGCISWFKNCNSSVSAHYVLRSSDGQITQMVLESGKAWHVGSENPYTIGFEHEGYRNQTGWYTTAMYTASAGLVKDICNSGYGINPLRTYNGPSCNDICTLGSCVKVKGHQHYPNQNHNDPGPNWDWYYFYNLINDNPTVTTYTTTTGSFYDSGGQSGNYTDDERNLYLIQPAGASSITVTFTAFDLETNWDYLYIYDGATTSAPLLGRYTSTTSPGTVTSSGGAILFDFRSDCATVNPGWAANWNATVPVVTTPDNINPTTSVSVPSNWATGNFPATFTDDDAGGSGLDKSYYQVLEYTGTEFRANNSNGFFSDNFDSVIHPDWTNKAGSWSVENGYLRQADTTQTNSNLYAYVRQDLSNRYLYNWSQYFGGVNYSGANRRAGLYFFCDSPDSSQRGNGYFVWFRLDQDAIQFYKVVNNSWGSTYVYDTTFAFNPNYWYDVKLTYDRITGWMKVYIDNHLSAQWKDSSPPASGNYISFRSANCDYRVNNLKVYRSRYSNAATTIKVGAASTNDIRYQNINPATPAGRVKSIDIDSAGNISSVAYQDINVDWTVPSTPAVVTDGLDATDIDVVFQDSMLTANWQACTDANSGIQRYWYAIGTSAGDSDVVGWTDNWIYDTVVVKGLSLVPAQYYYFSVRSQNGAGLIAPFNSSNGQMFDLNTNISKMENFRNSISVFPNPAQGILTIKSSGQIISNVKLIDVVGREVFDIQASETTLQINLTERHISHGNYVLKVYSDKGVQQQKISIN